MKTIVIGGTGHVGTYLIPRLVSLGHKVTCVTRGRAEPYTKHAAWTSVKMVHIDRNEEEKKGAFAAEISALKPDIVIDMICFTLESARHLVEGLRGRIRHFLSTGTVWVHGQSTIVPATEDLPKHPFGEYGVQKAEIEAYLLEEARHNLFPATVLHPGHIVGEGWAPLNPAGNFDPHVFEHIAGGETLSLPNFGLETVHHVHADDVAMAFINAIHNWSSSVGESFHIVSPAALTLRGYAEHIAAWFGLEPQLSFVPWEIWKESVSKESADFTWDHIAHSPNCSIEKARRLIGYNPRYTSLEAVYQSLRWLIDNKIINIL